jgi:hypothetical protein
MSRILHGYLKPCVQCSLANIHRNPINKEATTCSSLPGEQIFIDMSKLTHPTVANNKFWLIVVDDATDYTWSYFLQPKSDTTEKLLHFIHGMKERGTPVHRIRCDNAAENRSLQVALHNAGTRVVFEYTSLGPNKTVVLSGSLQYYTSTCKAT